MTTTTPAILDAIAALAQQTDERCQEIYEAAARGEPIWLVSGTNGGDDILIGDIRRTDAQNRFEFICDIEYQQGESWSTLEARGWALTEIDPELLLTAKSC